MKVFLIGSGKLANAILQSNTASDTEIIKWEDKPDSLSEKSIVVHAGSGRQLNEGIEFCVKTQSVLLELSTGLETENLNPDFTLIICPNTSVLLLKTMNLIKHGGSSFSDYKITITESHQSLKQSVPGTAYHLARSLHVSYDQIESIRDTEVQKHQLKIPDEYLDKHAYHKIRIQDELDEITIETKVLGHASYSDGVRKIINVILKNEFERRKYSVLELIDNHLL